MRTMSKSQLVDNIVQSWSKISPETICKSFKVCGQVLDFDPDELLCMREDKPCEGALNNLKYLLGFPTHQLDINTLEVLPEGVVQEVDDDINLNMINEDEVEHHLY